MKATLTMPLRTAPVRNLVQDSLRAAVQAPSDREGMDVLADALCRLETSVCLDKTAPRTDPVHKASTQTIEAAAKVILTQLDDRLDKRTMFERIAYAARIITTEANAALARLDAGSQDVQGRTIAS